MMHAFCMHDHIKFTFIYWFQTTISRSSKHLLYIYIYIYIVNLYYFSSPFFFHKVGSTFLYLLLPFPLSIEDKSNNLVEVYIVAIN